MYSNSHSSQPDKSRPTTTKYWVRRSDGSISSFQMILHSWTGDARWSRFMEAMVYSGRVMENGPALLPESPYIWSHIRAAVPAHAVRSNCDERAPIVKIVQFLQTQSRYEMKRVMQTDAVNDVFEAMDALFANECDEMMFDEECV